MKTRFFLILIAAALTGCENLHQTLRASSRVASPGEEVKSIIVGDHEFSSEQSLQAYVRSMPRGAVLSWDKSSLGTNQIPLPSARMTVDEFGRFCRANGAEFRVITAYERVVASRAYYLRNTGFRTYVDLIEHPPLPAEDIKPLFTACGVPFAADLVSFFREAGVPLPPDSSVTYDRETSRIIVTNTRENETILSRVIWSHETRVFDQKMRCLTTRLKTIQPKP